jgi:hypothetical protein
MNREQLQDIATRYIEFINTPDPTPDLLSQTTAQDVDVKIPYPGIPTSM